MDPLKRTRTNPKIERLLKVLNQIRVLDRELPIQVMAVFFYIASHDNCHKLAMEEDLHLTTASGSRNTDWLSKYHRLNKPGLDLITKEVDPFDRRRQILSLTPKGRQLAQLIEDILYGD